MTKTSDAAAPAAPAKRRTLKGAARMRADLRAVLAQNSSRAYVFRRSAFARILRSELAAVTPDGAAKYQLGKRVADVLQAYLERQLRCYFYRGGRYARKLGAQTLKTKHLEFVAALDA